MNVLTLSLWENFWWGLIYFDQFIFLKLAGKKNKYKEKKYWSRMYSNQLNYKTAFETTRTPHMLY